MQKQTIQKNKVVLKHYKLLFTKHVLLVHCYISLTAPTADGSFLPSLPYCHSFNKSLFILQTLTVHIEHISFKKRKNSFFFLNLDLMVSSTYFICNKSRQTTINSTSGLLFSMKCPCYWQEHTAYSQLQKNSLLTIISKSKQVKNKLVHESSGNWQEGSWKLCKHFLTSLILLPWVSIQKVTRFKPDIQSVFLSVILVLKIQSTVSCQAIKDYEDDDVKNEENIALTLPPKLRNTPLVLKELTKVTSFNNQHCPELQPTNPGKNLLVVLLIYWSSMGSVCIW